MTTGAAARHVKMFLKAFPLVVALYMVGCVVGFYVGMKLSAWEARLISKLVRLTTAIHEPWDLYAQFAIGTAILFASAPIAAWIAGEEKRYLPAVGRYLLIGILFAAVVMLGVHVWLLRLSTLGGTRFHDFDDIPRKSIGISASLGLLAWATCQRRGRQDGMTANAQ